MFRWIARLGCLNVAVNKPGFVEVDSIYRDLETVMSATDKNTIGKRTEGRLIAADFLTYTLKAFLIGVATSVVLSAGVVMLAQSSAQDDATTGKASREMKAAP
jgi:hypothetical protein